MSSVKRHEKWLFIIWGFLVDIALIIIRYFKTNFYYIEIHSYILGIIILATYFYVLPVLIGNIDALGIIDDPVVFVHLFLGFLMIVFIAVQFISGFYLRTSLYSKIKLNEMYLHYSKNIHKYVGIGLYLTGKFLMINGKYCEANWQGFPTMPYIK